MPFNAHTPARVVFNRMKRETARRRLRQVVPLLALACLLAFFVPGVLAGGTGPKLPNPGFRSVGLWDQTVPVRMDIAVWYPTSRLPRELLLEGWSLQVARNGAGMPGKYPVILLSHTTGASRLASHDLAAFLARNGFMVIAPTHPADNADDTRGVYRAALFADRPKHLLLALSAVERSPVLGPLLDRNRIGILGVGAGAATALQLASAVPDLSRLAAACPEEISGNPLCSQWAKMFHPSMQDEFATLLANGPEIFTPAIHRKTHHLLSDAGLNDPTLVPAWNNDGLGMPLADPAPDPGEAYGIRPPQIQPVLAVGLLTPGLVDLFPDASLHGLSAPVGILAVSNDALYPAEKSLDRLQRLLPHRPASRILHASHFYVQPPCPPAFLESFPALCGNQNPEADIFRQIRNEFFVRFFQKNLGLPTPPLPPEDRPS